MILRPRPSALVFTAALAAALAGCGGGYVSEPVSIPIEPGVHVPGDARRVLLRSDFRVTDGVLSHENWSTGMALIRRGKAAAGRNDTGMSYELHEAVEQMLKDAYRHGRLTQGILESSQVPYYSGGE